MTENNMPTSVGQLIAETCQRHAERPAFTVANHTLTFADVDRMSRAFAAYLQNQTDLQPGDRVAICLPNLLQFPIAAFGALRAGMALVNTNPLYTPREMAHQWSDSGAKALVILSDLAPNAAKIIDQTGIQHIFTTAAADFDAAQPASELLPNAISLMAALDSGTNLALEDAPRNHEDIAALQYTGGTTGVSKGAALSHGNLLHNARQTMQHLGDRCQEGKEIFVAPLPLYHIYAFTVNMLIFFSRGSHNVLIPNPRDMDSFVEQMLPYRLTGFAGLNTLFAGLCRHPRIKEVDFSALKLTLSGGTALTSAVSKLWTETTGCTISEAYGLSETSPVVSINPIGNEHLGTVGIPMPDTEVKVVDVEGKTLPTGHAGELCVRGPQVMQGYWQRPEETAKVMDAEGFFCTGDMAVISEDCFITIVDRKKDMIIVSGFNVYPNEVEDALCKGPGVLEAAVIGEPCEHSGEKVVAFVVTEGEMDEEALKSHCAEYLTGYKRPKRYVQLKELPKSAVGKILRKDLRA